MTQEEFSKQVAKLTAQKKQTDYLFEQGKIDRATRASRNKKTLETLRKLKEEAKAANLKARTERVLGEERTIRRAGEAPKGLREYQKELNQLKKDLAKASGAEADRIKSRISVVENVMKRFKTSAGAATLAAAKDAGDVSPEATEAPKTGRGSKGRPAKFARYAPIIDPKTGRVNLDQARYLSKKGVITKGELAQYEKLALTRNARRLPEAERGPSMRGEARFETPRPGVNVEGDAERLVRKTEKPKEKPKTSTKGNEPKNKPSGMTRPSYKIVGSDGKVNIRIAKKAYDDGVIDKGEFQEYKKRAMSQARADARAAARGEKKPLQLSKAQEAAANARDRAADMRDLANERDRAADIRESKRLDVIKKRAKEAVGKSVEQQQEARRERAGATQKNRILRERAERGAGRTVQERQAARAERLGKSAIPESVSKVKQVLNQPSVRTALKITGKLANKAMIAGMIYDTIKDPSMGKKSMDEWYKKNPDATLAEAVVASAKNTFGMDLGKSKALAKAEAAKRAGRLIPADRGRDKGARPYTEGRRADQSDRKAPVVRSPQTGGKVAQNRSVGRTGATGGSYTVKSGDNLWDIAQRNKTTVSALLKANPTIAQRRKAGKVDIYSGSKVRIPGKK